MDVTRLEDLKGKRVLIGVTLKKISSEEVQKIQFVADIIESSEDKGIQTSRKDNGGKYVFPPDLRFFKKALPGTYKLKTTGEEVFDPDLLMTLVMDTPDIKLSIRGFEGKKLFSAFGTAKIGTGKTKTHEVMALTVSMNEADAERVILSKLKQKGYTEVKIDSIGIRATPPPADSNPLLLGAYQRALEEGMSLFITERKNNHINNKGEVTDEYTPDNSDPGDNGKSE